MSPASEGEAAAERLARTALAACHRLAVGFGFHEGICNHFTLMLPDSSERFLLAPFGMHWSEIRASDFLVVDLAGNIVSGSGIAEETAFCIHAPIHKANPRARCVLHTHMPFATALSMLQEPFLDMALQTSVGLADTLVYDHDYAGLAFDASEGSRLARVLGDKCLLLMGNHGVLATGSSVAEAFDRLYFLERACQTQILALSTGRKLKRIAEPTLQKTLRQFRDAAVIQGQNKCDLHFASLVRMLSRREADFAD